MSWSIPFAAACVLFFMAEMGDKTQLLTVSLAAKHGPKFAFGIQTSANINTNPRTENGCITIDRELYEFYKAYFDGIKSFE